MEKKFNRMYELYKKGAEVLNENKELRKEFLDLTFELQESDDVNVTACAMSMRDQILNPELYVLTALESITSSLMRLGRNSD